jgi:hypothetical protein
LLVRPGELIDAFAAALMLASRRCQLAAPRMGEASIRGLVLAAVIAGPIPIVETA